MPVITIQIGSVSDKQKKDLIQTMTSQAVKVTGIPEEAFIVIVNELPDENIGVGGKTVDEIKKEETNRKK